MSNTPVSLAEIKKVARPIVPIIINLRINKMIVLVGNRYSRACFNIKIINPIIRVDKIVFFICKMICGLKIQ